MGWKSCVFVILVVGFFSCNRATAEIHNDNEFVRQIEQDPNEIDQTAKDEVYFETEKPLFSFNYWWIITVVSIVLNVALIYFIGFLIRNEKKNQKALKAELEKEKESNRNHRDEPKLSVGPREAEPPSPPVNEEQTGEEDKIHKVELLDEKSENPNVEEEVVRVPKVFYAEKVTETGEFYNVSEKLDPYKSYFKLIVDLSKQDEAEFELLDSEFILKQGSNAPDTYLYNACDPENSNQNFISEIVTVEKGIAHLVYGNWQIKQGHKAKIKFQ